MPQSPDNPFFTRQMTRRDFLKTAGVLAGTIALFPADVTNGWWDEGSPSCSESKRIETSIVYPKRDHPFFTTDFITDEPLETADSKTLRTVEAVLGPAVPLEELSTTQRAGLEQLRQTGGDARVVEQLANERGRCAIGEGYRISFIDTNSSTGLKLIGKTSLLPNVVRDIYSDKKSGLIFAALDTSGVAIIDVSDPENPVESMVIETDQALGVYVNNNTIYVADGRSGLKIFDLNKLLAGNTEQETEEVDIAGTARKVVVEDNLAYIASWSQGLQVVDLNTRQVIGSYQAPGVAMDIKVADVKIAEGKEKKVAYLAMYDGGVHMIDVGNPNNNQLPLYRKLETGGFCYGVDVGDKGRRVFSASKFGVEKAENILDPAASFRKVASVPGDSAEGIVLADSEQEKLLVADRRSGLRVIEGGREVGGYEVPGAPTAVALNNEHALIADWAGRMFIVDTKDGLVESYIKLNGRTWGIAVTPDKKFAIATDASANWQQNGIRIIDIQSAQHPAPIGFLPLNGYAYDVIVKNKRAFVACGEAGGYVIDISNPTAPERIMQYSLQEPGASIDLAVADDDILLSADATGGLNIINVTDLNSKYKKEIGHLPPAGTHTLGVATHPQNQRVAATAEGRAGFSIADISNPRSPRRIETFRLAENGSARDVFFDGSFLHVADGKGGIWIYRISLRDLKEPELIKHIQTPGYAENGDSFGTTTAAAFFQGAGVLLWRPEEKNYSWLQFITTQ